MQKINNLLKLLDCCLSIVQTQLTNFLNGQLLFFYNDNSCRKFVTIVCS